MLKNYINKNDVMDLVKKGNKTFSKVINYLALNQRKRVENIYSAEEYCPTSWWDIPEVKTRWNQLITGDSNQDYCEYLSKKYLRDRNNLKGLSLGCGTGHRELRWVKLINFQSIDAVDLSEHSISIGIKDAITKGVDHIIKYKVDDINKMSIPQNYYDVIFVEQSLHHFTPLKHILEKINLALKDNGYFIVNEFVGPSRFQWTERQITTINNLLAILPINIKNNLREMDIDIISLDQVFFE
jgi:ubiquinone/menaquinone biosynthesis C-methylase UbiE